MVKSHRQVYRLSRSAMTLAIVFWSALFRSMSACQVFSLETSIPDLAQPRFLVFQACGASSTALGSGSLLQLIYVDLDGRAAQIQGRARGTPGAELCVVVPQLPLRVQRCK